MEQENKQEQEIKTQNEEEGGIRRRLRDRDLLRKRKAEAEEKETNQEESQRKRSRTDSKGGTKKRGRPRKTEPAQQLPAVLEEATGTQEGPAVVVLTEPQPAVVISDLISGSPTPIQAVESQPVPLVSAPAPGLESVQSSLFMKSAVGPVPAPIQDTEAVLIPATFQDSIPAAPPKVETLYRQSQGREALDQVLIEDLGPDEEEDASLLQNNRADEGLNETLLINVPEQNKMFSLPTLSSAPLPQEYLP